uniref:hypothetical protein n=1 Tax=Roseburia sp. TaxID=2049040 RepID=UPI003FF107F1
MAWTLKTRWGNNLNKDQRIKELEKQCTNFMEAIDRVTKRNAELVAAEENTFLHSPTYIQFCEEIKFIKACRKLDEVEIARLKGKIPRMDDSLRNLYQDNKEMLEHSNQGDCEYFIGITQNWHEAFEYRNQSDEIHRLNGEVEQLKFVLEQRDREIERLQIELGEKKVQEKM